MRKFRKFSGSPIGINVLRTLDPVSSKMHIPQTIFDLIGIKTISYLCCKEVSGVNMKFVQAYTECFLEEKPQNSCIKHI